MWVILFLKVVKLHPWEISNGNSGFFPLHACRLYTHFRALSGSMPFTSSLFITQSTEHIPHAEFSHLSNLSLHICSPQR